jgi:aromatic ring-opening dioxygenase catalytic subunit (LigB family)
VRTAVFYTVPSGDITEVPRMCEASRQAVPTARQARPREEHLLPLIVIAGAAGDDRGRVPFSGARITAVHFGA